jgi:hypothetical protein
MRLTGFILLILISLSVFSVNDKDRTNTNNSETQLTLSGKVYDSQTGELLAGVRISVPETNLQAYTDFDGVFHLTIPSNLEHQILNVNFISYEPTVVLFSEVTANNSIRISPSKF